MNKLGKSSNKFGFGSDASVLEMHNKKTEMIEEQINGVSNSDAKYIAYKLVADDLFKVHLYVDFDSLISELGDVYEASNFEMYFNEDKTMFSDFEPSSLSFDYIFSLPNNSGQMKIYLDIKIDETKLEADEIKAVEKFKKKEEKIEEKKKEEKKKEERREEEMLNAKEKNVETEADLLKEVD